MTASARSGTAAARFRAGRFLAQLHIPCRRPRAGVRSGSVKGPDVHQHRPFRAQLCPAAGQESAQQLVDAVKSLRRADPGLGRQRGPAEHCRQGVDGVDGGFVRLPPGPELARRRRIAEEDHGGQIRRRARQRRGQCGGSAAEPARQVGRGVAGRLGPAGHLVGGQPRRQGRRPQILQRSPRPSGAPCPGGPAGPARSSPDRWAPALRARPAAHRPPAARRRNRASAGRRPDRGRAEQAAWANPFSC